MEPIFEASDLSVGYSAPILQDISFSLFPGEMVGVLGRNGCGKTTLLRAITGELPCISGEIRLMGENIRRLSVRERARRTAVMPQGSHAMPGITVMEAIAMGGYAREGYRWGASPQLRQRVQHCAEDLGISSFLHRDFGLLSQGQQQMVLLCRLLVQDTPLLLLDEPNAALDFDNARQLLHKIRQLVRQKEKGALLVLHDPQLALSYCSRLLIVHQGKIAADVSTASPIETLEKVLNILYPGLRVTENPLDTGYFCGLCAKTGV